MEIQALLTEKEGLYNYINICTKILEEPKFYEWLSCIKIAELEIILEVLEKVCVEKFFKVESILTEILPPILNQHATKFAFPSHHR